MKTVDSKLVGKFESFSESLLGEPADDVVVLFLTLAIGVARSNRIDPLELLAFISDKVVEAYGLEPIPETKH
jgi:hypothetical protein